MIFKKFNSRTGWKGYLVAGSKEPGILPKKTGQALEEHYPKHVPFFEVSFWTFGCISLSFGPKKRLKKPPSTTIRNMEIWQPHKLCQVTTAGAFGAREMWPVDQLHMTTLFCGSDPKKKLTQPLMSVHCRYDICIYYIHASLLCLFWVGDFEQIYETHERSGTWTVFTVNFLGGLGEPIFPIAPVSKWRLHTQIFQKTWLTWAPKETKYFLSPIFTADFAGASCCGLMKIPLISSVFISISN